MANCRRPAWFLAVLLLLPFSTVSRAQSAEGSKETGCLLVGVRWTGTLEDVAKIHETPVPERFRATLEAGGCGAFQLIRTDLVDWHLAFGDEASTGAAIAYLDRQVLRGAPVHSTLVSEVEAAVRGRGGAQPRTTVDDLVTLVTGYAFIASEYIRSADFYSSPALLAHSRRYADAAIAVALLLRSEQPSRHVCAETDRRCAERWANLRSVFNTFIERGAPDLDMHLAVVSARLGRTEADFDAARTVLRRNDDPNYIVAGNEAYRNGGDFCDIGDRTDLAEWQEVCEAGNLDRRATTYWHYRALFKLAAQQAGFPDLGGQWDVETAMRLRRAESLNHDAEGLPERRFGEISQRITELRFGQAEALLAKAREGQKGGRQGMAQAELDYYEALAQFWVSAYLVQGSDHPGWLRRIGTRYLEAVSELEELERASRETRPWPADIQRRAAWFRTILPQLDTLARGDAVH